MERVKDWFEKLGWWGKREKRGNSSTSVEKRANDIKTAINFAIKKHGEQKDDEGKLYVLHPLSVGVLMSNVTTSTEVVMAAILHDTIEDTDTTYEELEKIFGKKVADLVMEVTHEGVKDTGFYFPRLHSKEGIMIKFADRLSNLSRMDCWDKKRQEQYLLRSKFWKDCPPEQTKKEDEKTKRLIKAQEQHIRRVKDAEKKFNETRLSSEKKFIEDCKKEGVEWKRN